MGRGFPAADHGQFQARVSGSEGTSALQEAENRGSAVSYTHLDVYKRQVVDISLDNVTANVEIDATIRLLDADGNEITSSEIRKNVDSVKAVSYTHLRSAAEPFDG